MRILLISHALVTRSNHRLPEELARFSDIDLHVFTPEWWNEESRTVQQEKTFDPAYGIQLGKTAYVRQPMPNLFLFRTNLARTLRQLQPDILDVHEEPFSLAMGQILLLRQAFAPHARLIFYSWQNIFKRYPPPFSMIEQGAFRAARCATVPVSEVGDVLRHKGYRGPLTINPPGIDEHVFRPMPESRMETRAALHVAPDAPLLGYMGRLTPEKGIGDSVAALALLPAATRLLIIGGGDRTAVAAQAQALGIADRLVFTGAVNRLETPRFLNALDMLVVPSRTTPRWKEQFGRVIVEAALCGVPVIGSSSGAIPEVVGRGGLVFPEGNVHALANAARLLITQPNVAHQLGERARQRALEQFTWAKVAAQRHAIYKRVQQGAS